MLLPTIDGQHLMGFYYFNVTLKVEVVLKL